MKIFHRIAFILVLVTVFTLAKWDPSIFAEDSEFTRPTLRGLKGVYVWVQPLNPEIEQDGLSRTQIQTDVELRLRMAGIKVLSEEEWLGTPGEPVLNVGVSAVRTEVCRGYFYCIEVALYQQVCLIRILPNTTKYQAASWSTGMLAISPKLDRIRTDVKDKVDVFTNAYLSVNPKSTR